MRSLIRLAAMAAILYGLWLGWETWNFVSDATETTARVSRMSESEFGLGQNVEVQFGDEKRSRRTASFWYFISDKTFDVGDNVSVLQSSSNPRAVKLNDPIAIWFLPLLLVGGGILIRLIVRRKTRTGTRPARRSAMDPREVRSSNTYTHLSGHTSSNTQGPRITTTPTVRRRR